MRIVHPCATLLAALSILVRVHAATLVRLDENASEDLHTNTAIAIGSDGMAAKRSIRRGPALSAVEDTQ